MKICVELDEEMLEQWNKAKKAWEEEFNRQNNTSISFTDSEIFGGYLTVGGSQKMLWHKCFMRGLFLKRTLKE